MNQNTYLSNNQEQPRKKKTGLIIAIVSGLVLTILITAGVSYYVIGQMQAQNKTEVAVEQKQNEKVETKEQYFEGISIKNAAKMAEDKDVVILIGNETCSHCKTYKPKIKKFANDKKLKVYYVDLNLDENRENFSKYSKLQVEGTPTTLFFHKGEIVGRVTGDAENRGIEDAFENARKKGFQIS